MCQYTSALSTPDRVHGRSPCESAISTCSCYTKLGVQQNGAQRGLAGFLGTVGILYMSAAAQKVCMPIYAWVAGVGRQLNCCCAFRLQQDLGSLATTEDVLEQVQANGCSSGLLMLR